MSIDNNTTWEQVQVVEHYIEGEHAAHLPHGYFYPDMPAARLLQLYAIVPAMALTFPELNTPGSSGNPSGPLNV